ncbi:MAG: T9SS type A sorting domain-containing protein [Bacteroidota bacterium]
MKKFTHILFYTWAAVLLSVQLYAQPDWQRVNYTTSSVFTGIVTVNGENAQNTDKVGVFVNGECRMLTKVFEVNDTSFVSAVIHVDSLGEAAVIKFWDSQNNLVYELDTVLNVQSHGSIKRFPIEIKSEEIPNDIDAVETVKKQEVSVFPSTFNNSFTISSNVEIQKVSVYNTIGNLITVVDDVNQSQVSVPSSYFASGFYLVSVQLIDGTVVTRKIVKQ